MLWIPLIFAIVELHFTNSNLYWSTYKACHELSKGQTVSDSLDLCILHLSVPIVYLEVFQCFHYCMSSILVIMYFCWLAETSKERNQPDVLSTVGSKFFLEQSVKSRIRLNNLSRHYAHLNKQGQLHHQALFVVLIPGQDFLLKLLEFGLHGMTTLPKGYECGKHFAASCLIISIVLNHAKKSTEIFQDK